MADEHEGEKPEGEKPEGDEKETDAKSEELGEAGKRALENERKARKAAEKRAAEAEAKVKEAEDAEKTEVERLQGQVADLTKRAEASEAKATRFEVAAEKGLSLAQARRLVGSTKEELEADADSMRAELGLKDEGEKEEEKTEEKPDEAIGIGAQRPTEDLKPGASNSGEETVDAGKLADSIIKNPW